MYWLASEDLRVFCQVLKAGKSSNCCWEISFVNLTRTVGVKPGSSKESGSMLS